MLNFLFHMMDAKKDKVAILNDIFQRGGVERILSYMSTNLFTEREGVIFLFDDSKIDFEYSGQLLSLNVKAPPYASILEESFNLLKGLCKLIYAKKRYGVQVCISHKEGPNFINVLSNVSKSIVTVHEPKSVGIKYKGLKRSIVTLLIRILYNRANYVVAVSQVIARDLAVNFGVDKKKLRVIYNPCNINMIEKMLDEPLDKEHVDLFNSRVIVTAGRLEKQKGHWHLIRAFSQIRKHVNNTNLVILGDGDHLNYLQELVRQLDLEGSVYFLGFQNNLFKFISRSEVFVLTSLWEGFPAVLLEAMACMVPVVSVDCQSGPRELLAPERDIELQTKEIEFAQYGILTPPQDGAYKTADDPVSYEEMCISEAVIRVLENVEIRKKYAALGYKRVRQFSMNEYVAQWNSLITSAVTV